MGACFTGTAGCASAPALARHEASAQVLCWLKGDADMCGDAASAGDEDICGKAHMHGTSGFEKCMSDLGWRPAHPSDRA